MNYKLILNIFHKKIFKADWRLEFKNYINEIERFIRIKDSYSSHSNQITKRYFSIRILIDKWVLTPIYWLKANTGYIIYDFFTNSRNKKRLDDNNNY